MFDAHLRLTMRMPDGVIAEVTIESNVPNAMKLAELVTKGSRAIIDGAKPANLVVDIPEGVWETSEDEDEDRWFVTPWPQDGYLQVKRERAGQCVTLEGMFPKQALELSELLRRAALSVGGGE